MRQTSYEPSGSRGGGDCSNCEKPKRQHPGPHQFCPIIVVRTVVSKIGPGRFETTCPTCQKIHTRGVWSVAHMHVAQVMTCDGCGERCEVPPSR